MKTDRKGRSRSVTDIHVLYDRVAEKWARNDPALQDDFVGRPLILELARRHGNAGIIVDAGSGDGNVCRLVSPFAKQVVGVDLSKHMCQVAQRLSRAYRNIRYVRGDLMAMPRILPNIRADVCLAVFAVCCMRSKKELARAFRSMYGVVRPGGHLIAQIPHPAESFFTERSAWHKDADKMRSYFNEGQLCRRRLRTVNGDWLLVARYHFTLATYFTELARAGFLIRTIVEPRASPTLVRKFPSMKRESHLPSTLMVVAQRAARSADRV
jgi:SAM-dependent methyltransferase